MMMYGYWLLQLQYHGKFGNDDKTKQILMGKEEAIRSNHLSEHQWQVDIFGCLFCGEQNEGAGHGIYLSKNKTHPLQLMKYQIDVVID